MAILIQDSQLCRFQNTLAQPISFEGIGLHSGTEVTIELIPAPEDSGILFERTDLAPTVVIPASLDKVVDTQRSTNIGEGNQGISTIEHLMAALAAHQIDNLFIRISGSEVPIADGSSLVFAELIQKVGIAVQSKLKPFIKIVEPLFWSEGEVHIVALPYDGFKVSYTLDFPDAEAIGTQYFSIDINADSFCREIASCRTFGLYHWVAALMDQGLIKGGSLDNSVIVKDKAIFSKQGLRFDNEMVRHKVLDLIGDLALVGYPIQGHIVAVKSGHTSHVGLGKKILQSIRRSGEKQMAGVSQETKREKKQFEFLEVMQRLPHRYPFLLVDKIVDIDLENNVIVGQKNVSGNEAFFQGHFPTLPIMPGVLILEALAQTGGVLVYEKGYQDKLPVLLSVKSAKFRQAVKPGDVLKLHVTFIHLSGKGGRVEAKAMVDAKVAVEAEIGYAFVDKESI